MHERSFVGTRPRALTGCCMWPFSQHGGRAASQTGWPTKPNTLAFGSLPKWYMVIWADWETQGAAHISGMWQKHLRSPPERDCVAPFPEPDV